MTTNRILPYLQTLANSNGTKIAVANERSAATFLELASSVGAVAQWLASAPTPLVAYIALPGGPEFTAAQLGIIEAGSVAIPIPNKLTSTEAARYFASVPPDILFVSSIGECKPIVEALPKGTLIVVLNTPDGQHYPLERQLAWSDILSGRTSGISLPKPGTPLDAAVAMIQFTSGSTGWPKAILLTWENIAANQKMHLPHLERYKGTNVFCPIPQFHAMGNAVVLEHLLSGSSIHLANGFLHGEHLKCITAINASSIQASPNYFRMLLRVASFTPAHLPGLRYATIGSDWIDAGLIAELRKRFPDLTMFCRYGLSEAFGALSYNTIPPGGLLEKEGALGTLLDDAVLAPELTALREGNPPIPLRVRSTTAATHQLLPTGEKVSLFDSSGFLNTGDLVFGDQSGRLFIAGRESQFIKSNGHRVNPFEVEEVLRLLPEVHDAVVSGIADPLSGQRIVACIVTSAPIPPTVVTLRNHCMKHLSPYKIPQHFLFGVDIPKTHSGKVARKQLAELLPGIIQGKTA